MPLCLLVAFSSLFGFQYNSSSLSLLSAYVFSGVFLLACGAASLNSFQERSDDALMQRTQNRPMVLGSVSGSSAIAQTSLLVFSGLLILFVETNLRAFWIGALAVLLYNGVYTTLKPITVFALVPGVICGALPPYIGWLASGGEMVSFKALLPSVMLILWQIPHFLLVMLNHKMDYVASASPNILKTLSERALRRIFLPWITSLVVVMLTFTIVPSYMSRIGRMLIVTTALTLLVIFIFNLLMKKNPNYKYLFIFLNFSISFVMCIICVESFFS